jgi:hypothetical protein
MFEVISPEEMPETEFFVTQIKNKKKLRINEIIKK